MPCDDEHHTGDAVVVHRKVAHRFLGACVGPRFGWRCLMIDLAGSVAPSLADYVTHSG